MKVYCVFILLFFLNFPNLMAQNWGGKTQYLFNKAQVHHKSKEFNLEGITYDSILALNKGLFPDLKINEYAFEAHNLAGNYDRAMFFFEKYCRSTWLPDARLDTLKYSATFEVIRNNFRFSEILDMVISSRGDNQELIDEILNRRVRDQFFRKLNKKILESIQSDKLSMQVYEEIYSENDLNNAQWLEKIINKYGWLSQSQVGEKANNTLWLILQHSPLVYQEKLLHFLKESVDKGESSNIDYAMLIDRIHYNSLTMQVYGTQIERIEVEGETKNVVYPIIFPSEVNERRKSVGLEPLEEYAEFFNIKIENLEDLGDELLLEKIKIRRLQK